MRRQRRASGTALCAMPVAALVIAKRRFLGCTNLITEAAAKGLFCLYATLCSGELRSDSEGSRTAEAAMEGRRMTVGAQQTGPLSRSSRPNSAPPSPELALRLRRARTCNREDLPEQRRLRRSPTKAANPGWIGGRRFDHAWNCNQVPNAGALAGRLHQWREKLHGCNKMRALQLRCHIWRRQRREHDGEFLDGRAIR